MLNGPRQTWYYKQDVWTDFKKVYHTHKLVPSTKHFSAITNNNYGTAIFLSLIPTALAITAGILFTVFLGWLVGLVFFLASPAPLGAVAVRYINAYPHKGNDESRTNIDEAEKAFAKMHPDKQREYTKYLEAVYAETVDGKEVVQLFKSCADKTGIQRQLKDELQVQRDLHKLLGESNA